MENGKLVFSAVSMTTPPVVNCGRAIMGYIFLNEFPSGAVEHQTLSGKFAKRNSSMSN